MSLNSRIHFGLQIVFICLYITPSHYHHWANLSEDIEHKMPDRYILSSVYVRLRIFSQLYIIQYMGLCVFSLPISRVMNERTYTLSYYHHQIGSMNYYPLLRVRPWNNGMRCMSLYSYLAISSCGSDVSFVKGDSLQCSNACGECYLLCSEMIIYKNARIVYRNVSLSGLAKGTM